MPKSREYKKMESSGRRVVTKNERGEKKEYKVIGRTKWGLYLCEDVKSGCKECFDMFDLGKVEKRDGRMKKGGRWA